MPKCATCHSDQQTAYDHGVHAKAAAAGNTNVAKCQDCHGNVHTILPASDPEIEGGARKHSADLRRMPRAKAGHEFRRRQFRDLQLIRAKRAR